MQVLNAEGEDAVVRAWAFAAMQIMAKGISCATAFLVLLATSAWAWLIPADFF